MITLLTGTLVSATPSVAVLDVGGVGFELGISATTAAALPCPGESCRLHCRLQVREDALALFGFSSATERAMFDRLVAVSGVGPRLALAVLSTYSVDQLYAVVCAEDDKAMSKVPGVGKKTAQRLILELKGVFAKDRELSGISVPAAPAQIAPAAPAALDDVRAALLAMGFSPQEAELSLEGADAQGRVEDLLAAALRRLGADA